MGETEEFNTLEFEKKLTQLKDTQESIQSLSSWCLKQRTHHKKIVSSWLNVLKRVKIEQRLVLFYLANDVIQYSKRKNYEFVESWGLNLQKATPLVRDEKVRPKILRILKIWEQRSVYDDEFLSDLTGLLVAGAVKKTDDDLDFQPQQLVNKIKQCSVLEADTDLRLKHIHDCSLDLSDADALCANLKERCLRSDVEKEISEGVGCIERYTQALQREIVAREALLALLTSANQYYSTQRGEVKVVAYAYKNFGARVRALKRKLDELIPTLPSAVPSPPKEEDVPSPGPDEDLDLPPPGDNDEVAYNIDQTFNTTVSADGSLYNLGLSSFLTSDNPLAMFNEEIDLTNANKIEVINTRPSDKQDFSINDFLKTLTPAENNSVSPVNSVGSASQKSQDALPGLDLLTPDSTGNPPPPTSFYRSMDAVSTVNDDVVEQHYLPEAVVSSQWTNNAWNVPPVTPIPSNRAVFAEPPASPPLAPPMVPPILVPTVVERPTESAALDVDHRGILPPPPPPPVLPILGHIEDVDHRLMPSMPPLAPVTPPARHPVQQDVDHRNLISLTHQLPQRQHNPVSIDQDYRVPAMVPPPDIVESVDMDLSEDEEQPMYPQGQMDNRRNSFNNNKVLVGGEDKPKNEHTQPEQHSAPIIPPLSNPFEKMPPNLKFTMPPEFPSNAHPNSAPVLSRSNSLPQNHPGNLPQNHLNHPIHNHTLPRNHPNNLQNHPNDLPHNHPNNLPHNHPNNLHNQTNNLPPQNRPTILPNRPNFPQNNPNNYQQNPYDSPNYDREENSNDSAYEDDLRTRSIEMERNDEFAKDVEWNGPRQRFPRNWGPRQNFSPRGQFSPQFWPRNGPRMSNRWMGPRPQRFW
ncbi:formin-like protein 7 isoform X3 [Colias croceus]|uniref:formin-like protein 7 isoform X3 n=1 Tax=Colias crocea TaxID=72248 RepID=UPI001E27C87A|nr:formin-like protein 7 isoform X3 [Colias croceus]